MHQQHGSFFLSRVVVAEDPEVSFEREYIDSIKWRVKGRGREEKEDTNLLVP